MSRADEFLRLYNELSDHLRRLARLDRSVSFSRLVDRVAEVDATVRRVRDSLKDYGDLRNAIVHHRAYPQEIIAEPLDRTIRSLISILQEVRSPRRVIPAFAKDVRCFVPADPLQEALRFMLEHDFSQIVVRDASGLSLLTVEGIAKWFEGHVEDLAGVSAATIADALKVDIPSPLLIVSQDRTIYEAQDAFADMLRRNQPRLFAIVITATGNPSEKPIGIVTAWDLLVGY